MTLLYFIIVLCVVVCIHEFGHFYFAKKAGIYVYEFSIGMGPKLFQWHRLNDETVYSIRLFPIGGYVRMAGEEVELDQDIPEEKRFQVKTWMQKFKTMVAGVVFNFILAIVIFFIVALIAGVPNHYPYIGTINNDYPVAATNLKAGDRVLAVDGKKIFSDDHFLLELQTRIGHKIEFLVQHRDGKQETVSISPKKLKVKGEDVYRYGFALDNTKTHSVLKALGYGFVKTVSLLHQMILLIFYLCIGKIQLSALAGPVGIFTVIGESAKAGFLNVIYLVGFLSVNVGFINLLPIPAFDGGRIFFLLIEKVKGKPVDPKFENIVHAVGFMLLMVLMVVITYNDILRLLG